MKKTKLLSIILSLSLFSAAATLSGCAERALRLTADKASAPPGGVITLTCSGPDSDKAEFAIAAGEKLARLSTNGVLKFADDAAVGATVTVVASTEKKTSNKLTVTVTHREAEAVELVLNKSYIFIGTTLALYAQKTPLNATREVTYAVVGPAEIKGNELKLKDEAKAGDAVTVTAVCGGVVSPAKTLTVAEYSSAKALITFDNEMDADDTVLYDASLAGPPLKLVVKAFVKIDGVMQSVSEQITFRVDDESNGIVALEGGTVTALKHGLAKVWAVHELTQSEESVLIDVRKPPALIGMPHKWKNNVEAFYTEKERELTGIEPTFAADEGGSRDYLLSVEYAGKKAGEWNSLTTTAVDNQYVRLDGDKINFKQTGAYILMFSSLAGCRFETSSRPLQFIANNGVNVETAADFLAKMNGSDYPVVNIVGDLSFKGGVETVNSVGNCELNGNGFTIDLSAQKFAKDAFNDSDFLSFNSAGKEFENSYKVVLRDLDLIGNYGNLSLNQIAEKGGIEAEELQPPKSTDGSSDYAHLMQNFAYKAAIMITAESCEEEERDGKRKFATVTAAIDNVRIQGFSKGIVLEHVYDAAAAGAEKPAAVRNVTVNNLFGDGIVCDRAFFKVEDINVSNIGGAPFVGNGDSKSDWAGETRTQTARIAYGKNIECDNFSRGDSPYFLGQFLRLGGMGSAVLSAGIASVITPLLTLTRQNIINNEFLNPTPEQKKELKAKLDASLSCIIDADNTKFNLLHFSSLSPFDVVTGGLGTGKGGAIEVDYDFFKNGLDTTHKYLIIRVGTAFKPVLKEINKYLGFDLDTFVFIIVNRNYTATV